MLPDILAKKAIKTEVIKLSLLSFLIVSGGIIFGIFVPLREYLSWMDFTFYSTIGFLVIIYQTFSFYFKARKIKQLMSIDFDADIFENVPGRFHKIRRQRPFCPDKTSLLALCRNQVGQN